MKGKVATQVNPPLKLQRSPVSVADTPEVGRALQEVLIDLLDLANQTKQAHWAVVGPHFMSLHVFLDTINATCQLAADETAERLNAIDLVPDGRIETIKRLTHVEPFPAGAIADSDVITLIADRLSAVIARIRKQEEPIREVDVVSSDLLIGHLLTLEKHLWMLQAHETGRVTARLDGRRKLNEIPR